MGQTNLIRTLFEGSEILTSSVNSNIQTLDFTRYFKEGDYVSIIALDAHGCQVGAALATNLTLDAIDHGTSVILSAAVDTSTALPAGAVGWYLVPNEILTGEEAIDRLYRCYAGPENVKIQLCVNETPPAELDTPIVGQSRHLVDDITCFRVGDTVNVISDSGLLGTASIVSLDANADEANNLSEIVLDDNIDTTAETNVQICADIEVSKLFTRLKENVDAIDQPIENEYVGDGDCELTAFSSDELFLQGTSHLYLDGRKLRLGTAGTQASLDQGTYPGNNDSLRFTSLVLGTLGNEVEAEVVAGAGLTVTVTKTFAYNSGTGFTSSQYLVQVNDNGGAATAQEIADAINADPDASRIMLAQYGGDGSGVVATFGPTALAGGLDDGTGDYAELAQIYNNEISLTGYKIVSLHIRPEEKNRLDRPPRDTEELVLDYRKALTNA